MEVREWALIGFTILSQMAVGSLLVVNVVRLFAGKLGAQEVDRLSDWPLLALLPVMGLALLVSLLHLSQPLNAPQSVTNLASSWLSREIFCAVLFTGVAGLFELAQWRKIGSPALRTIVAWVAALIGIALVYVMANAYMLRTVPAWNTPVTPVSFFTTALLLGTVAMGAGFAGSYAALRKQDAARAEATGLALRSIMRWLALAALVLLGVEFVVAPFYAAGLTATNGPEFLGTHGLLFVVRFLLVFAGAGIAGLFIHQSALVPGREKVLSNLAYAGFAVVLVSEVLGRVLFYVSRLRIGI